MKLSEVPDSAPAGPAEAPKRMKLSEVWDQTKGSPAPAGEAPPSRLGALWEGLKKGVTETGVGMAQLASRMPTLTGIGAEGRQKMMADIDARAQQGAQAYNANAARQAFPMTAGFGRFAGNVASTAPLALVPGGAASLAARVGLGAAQGALAGGMAPVEEGDYWTTKAKQLAIGGTLGAALPAAGGLTRSIRPEAQTLMNRGVPLTPGQQSGGALQLAERTVSRFPVLGEWLRGTEERSLDGFNRVTVAQALEPIGVKVPKTFRAGHDLVEFGYQAERDAYNRLLPGLILKEDPQLQAEIKGLRSLVSELGDDAVKRFESVFENRVNKAFGPPPMPPATAHNRPAQDELGQLFGLSERTPAPYNAPIGRSIDGLTLKRVTMDLDKATRLARSQDGTGRALASAYEQLQSVIKQSLARQNPQAATQLKNLDYSYAMMSRIREAVGRRADSEGKFTPIDLLHSIKQNKREDLWSWATGDRLMQAFAEAGNRVLGKRLPDPATYLGPLHELTGMLTRAPAAAGYGARVGAGALGTGARAASPAAPLLGFEGGRSEGSRGSYVTMGHETNPPP